MIARLLEYLRDGWWICAIFEFGDRDCWALARGTSGTYERAYVSLPESWVAPPKRRNLKPPPSGVTLQ